jgi:N-acetyl-1-D-myo-inositol-2-amino-2-deoxy-alpha-D-glucopyranoside deacetylase
MTTPPSVVGVSGKRVLAVYGHPDDEGQATGSLAAFLAEGNAVTLVCTTRGEVGEISDPALATPETLGYTRELELRAAMAQIGLADVRFLPFRDSGMDGTPENDDERCFHRQPADVAVAALLTIMREVRPHFVFTWQADGGYGHPDHIAAHRHTVAAFDACGDPDAYPETGAPWAPERLYWGARTMKQFANMRLELERRGLLPEPIDDAMRMRFAEALARPDPPVSVTIDCARYADAKRRAASMHRSQFGESSMFARIPDDMRARFFGEERFFRGRPEFAEGEPARTDFR